MTVLVYPSLVLVGLLLRLLVFAASPDPGNDIRNFADTAAILARGGNIYTEQIYYNYSPAPALISALLAGLPLHFVTAFRWLVAVFDLANAALVAGVLHVTRPRYALWGFVLVWLSLPLIVASPTRQFDSIALTPLLCALWWSVRWRSSVLKSSKS